ncbi:retrovirus-related pol polyprotein from transposon TNT 1-94 [Tanacetum coccineum]|uniref:Retrovirus-related pol polyprotein from transposon TNT 1-94 n=1 Tax=Tanacetum coccineum TaxID=301880 RepID=A0ABQ5GNF9_9ASTR
MEETYHVTFSEDDEAIYKSSTEGDEINFNENKSFPDDVFSIPRNNVSQCSGNDSYFPYVRAYDLLSTINITIPDPITPSDPITSSNPITSSKPITISNESFEFTTIHDHLILNEPDNSESVEDLEIDKDQVSIIRDLISEVEPSTTANVFEIEPKKLVEALEEDGWIIAMQEEQNQFERNKVYTLGYNQHEGIDYDETFANVARLEIIRIFLAYAAYMGFIVFQMDVKSAFLNRNISEEVYVQQPPGFKSIEFPNHVCKLDKSLYGLKQAPKAWYQANPKESYLVAIKRIFKYLKGTPNLGLWYPKGSGFNLKAYSDSDYAGCNLDRKSTSGGCQILGGKLVPIFCNNTSAIAISNNSVLHSRTKHIDISEDFVLIPPKATMKAGLATLGLTDENDALLSSSDLINSSIRGMQGSHDQLNVNQKTITYLSLIMEHLLGDAYINENLKTLKPIHITSLSFKPTLENKVPLTAHMCKVANLSPDLIKSLIPPSREVNSDDSTDKSSSRTTMQPITLPKAPTDLKLRKKRILPSSKPKSSNLDASESVEEQGNQLKPTDAKKVQKLIDEEFVKEFGLESVRDIPLEEFGGADAKLDTDESPYDTESEIKRVEEPADSGLHFMPDDEVMLISRFEAAESNDKGTEFTETKVSLTHSEEATADNILDEMATLKAFADKPSDPLGHLRAKIFSLSTKVENLESSLAKKVINTLEDSVP